MASLIGKTLGKYQIQELIAQGGMTTVYRGVQADSERSFAIKVLPPHPGGDAQYAQRFLQEARTIAKLQHPRIVPVYDFGNEEGVLFLVMPEMTGGSLRDYITEGPVPIDQVSGLLTTLAPAIDTAHRHGIIHRDIKPDNIHIDDEGYPVLSGFGVAKLVEGNAQFTASGGFLGTPAYMAPEQSQGYTNINGRADVYALGIVTYEMLTGRHPYSAETPMMVMFKHVSDPVPSLRDSDTNFPQAIDMVLQRALAKNREDRYASATQFADAFREALAHLQRDGAVVTYTTPVPSDDPTVLASEERRAPPQTPDVVRSTSTAPATPRRRGGLVIFGAIILILIVGVVALFALGGDNVPLLSAANTDTPTPTPTQTFTPSATATSTHTNTPTPTNTPTNTNTPTATPTATLDAANLSGVVSVVSADILIAPDQNSGLVAQAVEGTSLRISAQITNENGERFYFVESDGIQGWILEEQLAVQSGMDAVAQQVTLTHTPTSTSTPTATATATFTLTATATDTPTVTPSHTATHTPTNTPSHTPTATFTNTPTATYTFTSTPTPTFTKTFTPSPTHIPTLTATNTVTATPTPPPSFGQVTFATASIPGDTVILNVSGLALPPEGQGYFGWLYSQIEDRWLALGPVPLDGGGGGQIQLAPAASSLHARYNAVALSLEANTARPNIPEGPILYSGALPEPTANAFYQILIEWTAEDLPPEVDGMSLLDIALSEQSFAEEYAALALDDARSGLTSAMRDHAEQVFNVLQGGEQDINGGGSVSGNPGNLNFGLLTAANTINDLLVGAALADGIDPQHQAELVAVQTCANNAVTWSQSALTDAQQIANAEDVAVPAVESWYLAIVPIGPGQDINGNLLIESIEGECGLRNLQELAVSVNSMTILEGIIPFLPDNPDE